MVNNRLAGIIAAIMVVAGALPAQAAGDCRIVPTKGSADPQVFLLSPQNDEDRHALLKTAAFDATVYGLPAFLQYKEMYRQAVDKASGTYSGFNTFQHERKLAGPSYAPFKVPNSDTLYSTAWLDLTAGPVEIEIPSVSLKYYTLNMFDTYGNPSNLSTRTLGSKGGRFLLIPPKWKGDVPPGLTAVKVATAKIWVLMRVFAQTSAELGKAHSFQDSVKVIPRGDLAATETAHDTPPAPGSISNAGNFFRVLDYILHTNGHLIGEDAFVNWFRSIDGLGSGCFDPDRIAPDSLASIQAGHEQALNLVQNARNQLGEPTGTGWKRTVKGFYGFNYLRRAVNNMAGLGGNVPEENASFNTFVDASGAVLDGSTGRYRLHLKQPPPVDAFWSVTLYDARTFQLHANPLKRYLINDRTPGLKIGRDGSVDISIQPDRPKDGNWLPAPAGPFFLLIRSYLPKAPALNGQWLPPAVERVP